MLGVLLLRRRRALLLVLALVGCGSGADDRESSSQSNTPITVKIVEPIPTFENGELTIAIGASGRDVEARVTPSTGIDRVELLTVDDASVLGRLARPPFRFRVPVWVLGEEGRRLLCIQAVDARGRRGEACFNAVR